MKNQIDTITIVASVAMGILVARPIAAHAEVLDFASCSQIAGAAGRLACYDAAARPASISAAGKYLAMDIADFKTDRSKLRGRKIEVRGYMTPFADGALLMAEIGDLAGVVVDIAQAPRDERRKLASCTNVCRVTVQGVGGKAMLQDGIKADHLLFD